MLILAYPSQLPYPLHQLHLWASAVAPPSEGLYKVKHVYNHRWYNLMPAAGGTWRHEVMTISIQEFQRELYADSISISFSTIAHTPIFSVQYSYSRHSRAKKVQVYCPVTTERRARLSVIQKLWIGLTWKPTNDSRPYFFKLLWRLSLTWYHQRENL